VFRAAICVYTEQEVFHTLQPEISNKLGDSVSLHIQVAFGSQVHGFTIHIPELSKKPVKQAVMESVCNSSINVPAPA
jgi:hypothetical protein